jgi:hypothetical protein
MIIKFLRLININQNENKVYHIINFIIIIFLSLS